MTTDRRRALVAACLANAVEWYDFAVYGAMAAVLATVLLPPSSGSDGLVAVFAVFATSFLARPVGAVLVGLRADRQGRRGMLAAMVLLMSGATAAIGLLPSWTDAGLVAPAALVLLRLVQGFASGGEISSSITFLVESAPRGRWGRYGGWHTATVALGIASGIAVAGLASAVLSTADLEAWGWRLPFLLALPLGAVGLYVRLRLAETPEFSAAAARAAPSLPGVWRAHGRTVWTGFLMVAVLAGTFNLWFVFLPSHLAEEDLHPLPVALACAAAGLVAAAIAAPILGGLSDRVGRRPLLLAGTGGLALLVLPLYAAARGPVLLLLLADLLVGVLLGCLVVSAHLSESFPVAVRATGIALTFGLATALVGGTAPLIGSLLARADAPLGIPLYLVLLGVAGFVATVRAPPAPEPAGVPAPGDAAVRVLHDGGRHADGRAPRSGGP